MTWENDRTSASHVSAVRTAHSDDAKQRSDETTQLRPGRRGRLPGLAVMAGGVLLVVVGGAIAVALTRGGTDDAPASAESSSGPRDPAASKASSGQSRAAVSGPLEFDTRGTMTYVLTSSQGSESRPVSLRMHVTCSERTCQITSVNGYLPDGVAQRPLSRTGDVTWSAPGRASRPGCGAGGDEGLASAELTLSTESVRLTVHREGAELKSSKCVDVYATIDGTFSGPRP